ncbi:MAG TPA: hypothetical protein P5319_12825, partial [Gemmatimonadales bacterium]|nr:hypothetical protein [Gemmatimonadales bacterium]
VSPAPAGGETAVLLKPGGSVSTAAGGQANALTGEEAADTDPAAEATLEGSAEAAAPDLLTPPDESPPPDLVRTGYIGDRSNRAHG